jgi:hypothetical protein
VNLCITVDFNDEHWLRYTVEVENGKEQKGKGWGEGEVLVRTNEGSKYRLMTLRPVNPYCDVTLSLVHSFVSVFPC